MLVYWTQSGSERFVYNTRAGPVCSGQVGGLGWGVGAATPRTWISLKKAKEDHGPQGRCLAINPLVGARACTRAAKGMGAAKAR